MDSQTSTKPSSKQRGKGTISLEEYLNFLEARNQNDLTVNYLNQIICMHGFRKIQNAPKKVIADAVKAIDLIDPSRSTLNQNISSCAFISLEEVTKDLEELNWQECCVISMQTLNSWKENFSSQEPVHQSAKCSNSKSKAQASKLSAFPGSAHGGASSSFCTSVDGECPSNLKHKRPRRVVDLVGACDGGHNRPLASSYASFRSC